MLARLFRRPQLKRFWPFYGVCLSLMTLAAIGVFNSGSAVFTNGCLIFEGVVVAAILWVKFPEISALTGERQNDTNDYIDAYWAGENRKALEAASAQGIYPSPHGRGHASRRGHR